MDSGKGKTLFPATTCEFVVVLMEASIRNRTSAKGANEMVACGGVVRAIVEWGNMFKVLSVSNENVNDESPAGLMKYRVVVLVRKVVVEVMWECIREGMYR